MPHVFINYRTGDGEQASAHLDDALRRRFGDNASFRDGRSIRLGRTFQEELRENVRACEVLLVLAGPGWAARPELWQQDDWVREEILEALRNDVLIVPVLLGRGTARPAKADLPPELASVADRQCLTYEAHRAEYDVPAILQALTKVIPAFASAEEERAQATETTANGMREVEGVSAVQAGSAGDISTTVNGSTGAGSTTTHFHAATGSVHTGSGNQHLPQFSGDGPVNYTADNHGTVNNSFGNRTADQEKK
ncbi:toll/interleukin-1 receptor domain-containing protein [Streptomyces albidoflavus]|uniref:toll/interleukin-1 receptor domain-containing protein n=1 Tax=Streptomyces TaxID=1883 RepID=UPI001C2E545B|nr:toll/interleukin-1 receptor domain-containing protein [Streptomyces sp. BV333]MBV1955228.1 toll/interleukin-1 receptor domain-containing protein [Streptomyces sp. BV333]